MMIEGSGSGTLALLIAQGGAVEPAAGEPAKHADEERLGDQAAQGGNAAHPLWQTSRQV
jgi:hypothetical protein